MPVMPSTPPSIVAEIVLDIVTGRIAAFKTLTDPDAAPLLALRISMTDEAWIAMNDTLDEGTFFQRFGAAMAAG
jgi:hypothetical protein